MADPVSPDLTSKDLTDFLDLKTAPATPATPPAKSDTDAAANLEQKWKLLEKRFEYAWNFFEFHATQRTTMFNFFLVFAGFILTGYTSLLKDGPFPSSIVVAVVGAALTTVFIFLDRRNEELVHIAEDVLESLEAEVLFAGYKRTINWPKRRTFFLGRMKAKPRMAQLGLLLRQSADNNSPIDESKPEKKLGPSPFLHRKWIPTFQFFILVLFLVLAGFSWHHRNETINPKPSQVDVRIQR